MNKDVICIVAVAPLRKEPAHRSEQVSQLLLGETAQAIEEKGDFSLVRCGYDGYEGWIQRTQVTAIKKLATDRTIVVHGFKQLTARVNEINVSMLPGSEIYLRQTHQDLSQVNQLDCRPYHFTFPETEQIAAKEISGENVVSSAMHYLGTPYSWGGKSTWGIDCSGLVQMAFKLNNMFMPRDAWQQAEGGDDVGFLSEASAGDLAFFDNEQGRITHVGILLNNHEIIHASGHVKIDDIDSNGIINRATGDRTHKLRIIKRFF